MRLIDADALKQAIRYNMPTRAEVGILIDAIPDAIVRCKDCKHGRLYEPNCVNCEYMELARDADWFCADGERA